MKVLADAPPGNGCRGLAIDTHFVYAAGTEEVVAHSKKDLSVVKRVPVVGRPVSVATVADRWLFVGTEQGRTQVFALPDMTPADPASVGLGIHLSGKGESATRTVPVRTAGGWLYDGVVFDSAFKKALGVLRPRGVAQHNGANGLGWVGPGYDQDYGYGYGYPNQYGGYSSLPAWLGPWGVTVQQQSQFTHNKRAVQLPLEQTNQFGGHSGYVATAVLPDRPAVVSVRHFSSQTDFGRTTRMKAELVYHDVATVSVAKRLTLLDESVLPNTFNYGFQPRLEARDGVVVCLFGERLLAVPTPKMSARQAPPVPHFDTASMPLVVADKDVTVKLPPVKGMKALAGYDNDTVLRGLSVEGDSVTLKAEPIRERISEQLLGVLANQRHPNTGMQKSPDDTLSDYLKNCTPVFEKLTGRKPNGIPVWVSVDIVARDKNTDRADGQIGVFVEVPTAPLLAKAKAQYEEALLRSRPVAPADPRIPELLRNQTEYQKRVTELEKKLDESNAKLDRLLKALEPKKQ